MSGRIYTNIFDVRLMRGNLMEVNFFFFLISYGSRLERIIDYIPWTNGLETGTELGFEPEGGQSLKPKKNYENKN